MGSYMLAAAATRPEGTFDSGPRGSPCAQCDRMVRSTGERADPVIAPSSGCGCGPSCEPVGRDEEGVRKLPIVWQRLVSEGVTCPRCAGTETEVERAVTILGEVLRPLGIEPTLEPRELDRSDFEAAPDESNRIFIAGRPLEDWIGATPGASECCSVCGANQCRTVEVDGTTFETVPASLIVKAGLAAAASLLDA